MNAHYLVLAMATLLVGCSSTAGGSGDGRGGAGPSDGFDECRLHVDCMLVGSSCCQCGTPELGSVTAINKDQQQAYQDKQACATQDQCACPGGAPNPSLFATCEQGRCLAVDLRAHELSACKVAADCQLRVGLACCQGCSSAAANELVAIRVGSQDVLQGLTCHPETGAECPVCAPEYPSNAEVACVQGHCEVLVTGQASSQ